MARRSSLIVADGPSCGRGVLPQADIVISDAPGVALAVQTADCVPVVILIGGLESWRPSTLDGEGSWRAPRSPQSSGWPGTSAPARTICSSRSDQPSDRAAMRWGPTSERSSNGRLFRRRNSAGGSARCRRRHR